MVCECMVVKWTEVTLHPPSSPSIHPPHHPPSSPSIHPPSTLLTLHPPSSPSMHPPHPLCILHPPSIHHTSTLHPPSIHFHPPSPSSPSIHLVTLHPPSSPSTHLLTLHPSSSPSTVTTIRFRTLKVSAATYHHFQCPESCSVFCAGRKVQKI